MPSPSSDRNLLFGILAVQMDFISRDGLITAMNAWVLHKSKPLGQILRQQGVLSEEHLALLDALVQAHIKQHGNDPQQSLAAVSSLRSVRQDLHQIADADVQASLMHVSTAPRDPEATTGFVPPSTLPPHARFQILRPHARGGLGEVFVAHDEELDREVALKEIQQRHADHQESRARFLTEAKVTGALEHPGIVPVYGLGTYADGRPFYAMRFIQGDSLKAAIARYHQQAGGLQPVSLEFRQLLGRFVDVCNAIAYAHSRGVLHRDLKPGNVMLGKYGETLVVDWGLAKVLGRAEMEATEGVLAGSADSALTQAGKAMGTPAFVSPEQAAGRLDQLGPASDVYSLGATLYCLLTGQAPFRDADAAVVLRKVQKGDFPAPRQVNPRVPPALEAVCLKAMALRPEDRYPTPRELAGEIEHWLADEPVGAYREPLTARVGRWVRRHQTLAAGIGALLLTGVIALSVSTLLIGRAQQQTAEALHNEEQARRARVLGQLDALSDAAPGAVPAILADLEANRAEVLPRLRERYAEAGKPARRMRLALALLPVEPDAVRDDLVDWMLHVEDPAEAVLVRDVLVPHGSTLKASLWAKGDDAQSERFRALVALAAFDPNGEGWKKHAAAAVKQMVTETLHLGTWVKALNPVREALQAPLAKAYREEKSAERRELAAQVLANYAADNPGLLAELLLDADGKQAAWIRPVLERHREAATARMRQELATLPDYWKDAPVAWKEPAAELRREVEQAGGLFNERFALCQALPLERLAAVTEGLRPAGYRPVRVRPWNEGEAVRVAVVWTRDGVEWKLQTGLTVEQVAEKPEGLLPADVAGYHTRDGARFAVLHRKGEAGEQAVVYASVAETDHVAQTKRYPDDGFIPATLHGLVGQDGVVRYSGVWWKGTAKPPAADLALSDDANTHAERVLAGEQLLLDVGVSDAGKPRYASVWREETTRDAVGLHGLAAEAHLARCRELAAQGYRPVGLSLALLTGEKLPLAASVWHRPALAPAEQERAARRQGMAGAMLMRLAQAEEVWPLWRHSPDPTVRSYLVERASVVAVDPEVLIRRLDEEKETSTRRALIVALGEYTEKELPTEVRGPLVTKLLGWYRDDPDAGIHGAIDWLLRHGMEGPVPRRLDWGQRKELERIDQQLRRRDPDGQRSWYVNGQGQTFTLIGGPVEFRMGSPLTEADRIVVNEKPHVRVIPRSYAIATKAVTVREWEQFLKERPEVTFQYIRRYSPAADGPIVTVDWFLAAQYCNWLSEKEGIPKEQWCYPEKIGDGMKVYPDHWRRTGYRLTSEAEWEYACRAGSMASRSYGASEDLLPRYAWYQPNSQDRAWPVGQKRPNDLGLFDLHGNAWTWCEDLIAMYPGGRSEDVEDIRDIINSNSRILRGTSFSNSAPGVRSANRSFDQPGIRVSTGGLRVSRTYH